MEISSHSPSEQDCKLSASRQSAQSNSQTSPRRSSLPESIPVAIPLSRSTKKPVPLYIIEEHHEAFILWHHAMELGLMPTGGNMLLHIDAHADLDPPVIRSTLAPRPESLSMVAEFTYRELGISTFVLPAIHRGIFNRYCWIHQPVSGIQSFHAGKRYVRTYKNMGLLYICGQIHEDRNFPAKANNQENPVNPANPANPANPVNSVNSVISANSEDQMLFSLITGTIDGVSERDALIALHDMRTDMQIRKRANLNIEMETDYTEGSEMVLDIDLDYFSLSEHDPRELSIEITEDEFRRIMNDPYHFIRLDGKCHLQQIGDRFILFMNRKQGLSIRSATQVTEKKVIERIDALELFLANIGIRPSIIHLCRSRHSGYTPSHQWKTIEDSLMAMLQKLYGNLNISSLSEILH
ncbi:MAG: hypothetical protein CVV64_13765 [Candidatus Wallbacteria bacterium HGW-Wallbacteria-1]|jgi:hypothetical protein|uniref:Uncharacterized protein n=1 Tax=Candidatus Wallbacteria bacterium HGW-Wallbacteria-1 TaxID=2013854 RepID=A0A2N1PMB0_9BACT|nr:MAG: hypothetical protein CVV64_13765 [Candidatus Wallbacteria bacterium HGW-Wallbacteria-1]